MAAAAAAAATVAAALAVAAARWGHLPVQQPQHIALL